MFCLAAAALGFRGGGVRGRGLGQTHASRAGRPVLLAPEYSEFDIPEQRVAQSAEREIAPAALGLSPAFLLENWLRIVAIYTIERCAEKAIDHGSLLNDPVLSDSVVVVAFVVAIYWVCIFLDQKLRARKAQLLAEADQLKRAAPQTSPPGLTELLNSVELNDTLKAATDVCKVMGADHVTDLVGHEYQFVQELFMKDTDMPEAKRDMLLKALKDVSLRHGGGSWTKEDRYKAVEALKALNDEALAERMYRLPPP